MKEIQIVEEKMRDKAESLYAPSTVPNSFYPKKRAFEMKTLFLGKHVEVNVS